MKKKDPVIKTRRLVIQPMSDSEIENLAVTAGSEELRAAYGEMLSGCRRDPEHRIWYAPWRITLKGGNTCVGDLGFKGPAKDSAVEIGYGVLPEYEGRGYATEAVRAMALWAFGSGDAAFVEAQTAPDNKASQRVLEKCGFVPDGIGEEGPRFVLENPPTNWIAIYMMFGLSIGTALGISLGNLPIGVSMGICIGLCIGAALNSSAQKKRAELKLRRKNRA